MMNKLLIVAVMTMSACTTGHRGAQLNWAPGDEPAFDCECDGVHDFPPQIEESEESDELSS